MFKTFLYFVDPIAFNVYNKQHLTMERNTPTNVVYDAVITTMGMPTMRSMAFSQRPLPGCMCLPGQVVWLQRKYLMLKFWLTETEKN